ncbi:MAG: TolC family protein, partial [Deltaproteobacteria bacterium]|nr:TolC family protein [Deltaproteobacteria bacterium]
VSQEHVAAARSRFYPRLDLNAAYGYSDRALFGDERLPGTDRNTHALDSSIGMIMSFNLFNGNVDSINLQNARIDARSSVLALKDIENELAGLVREKMVMYQKRVDIVELETRNTLAARQNMELMKERYATGAADSLDFRDAQVKLNSAQTTLITARFQARITHLDLQQLTGEITVER